CAAAKRRRRRRGSRTSRRSSVSTSKRRSSPSARSRRRRRCATAPTGWPEIAMPWSSPSWDEAPYFALDLETSGLGTRADEILALALVPIRGGVIRFGERFSSLVRPADPARLSQEGLRAHHLLPAELAAAPPIGELLDEVDSRLRAGILVLHHAPL